MKQKSKHIAIGMVILAIFLVCFLAFVTHVGCPIKYLTGISCPGCGMTRACIDALYFDFASAFAHHPLWPALPVSFFLLGVFIIKRKRRAAYVVLSVTVVLLVAVYLYRLTFADSAVVEWDIRSGFLYRLFTGNL